MAPPTVPFHIFVAKFVLLAAVFPIHSVSPTSINLSPISPLPTQCESFTFRWTGGTPPFFVDLFQQDGPNQRHLGPTNHSSYQWVSDFPRGTKLQAKVSDHNTDSKQTPTFVVQAGPLDNCLGSSVPSTLSTTESNSATPSADPTVHGSTPTPTTSLLTSSLSASASMFPSISAAPTPSGQSQALPPSGTDIASTVPLIGPQSSPVSSSYEGMSTISNRSSGTPDTGSSSISILLQTPTSSDAPLLSLSSPSNPTSAFKPPASISTQQSASSQPRNGGRVAAIIVGCLAAAILAALALVLLQKRRRAKQRSRVASMTTLDTLALTATTWSDLSPPEPDKAKPLGANKGVTEWNADLFARDRDSPRKQQNARSAPSPWIPFTPSMPQAPFRRAPRITSLSTIPEASIETSVPSPVESDDSASTAPSLHSYPPLVPQTLSESGGLGDHASWQYAYPPMTPPSAQVPVNPFRARLLAAAASNSNGAWARSDGPEHPFK